MNFVQPLRALLVSFVSLVTLSPVAIAHPGHDHSDIPSVIRHPFAGVEHVVVIGALVVAAMLAMGLALRVRQTANRHGARPRTDRVR